jgi:hypothetical protein
MKKLSVLAILLLLATRAFAQSTPADYALAVGASVQESPAQITLHWAPDARAVHFYIYRRVLGSGKAWSSIATATPADSSYADKNVQSGVTYEYRVIDSARTDSTYARQGFIASGIAVTPAGLGTSVILIVDKTYTTALKTEIDRLIADLVAEGRKVIRHDVNRTDAVTDIFNTIQDDYNNDGRITTVFLLGHVPVPYSGDLAPDGHVPGKGNHQGAWPADMYYGSFYTNWTDETVNDTTAYDVRNKNIPGDGKFDQNAIEAAMDLEVGRVDLYGLPAYSQSDTALLKRYLDRDHAFRTGQLTAPQRALINDNFGIINDGIDRSYDVPSGSAWRNFPPLVGRDNIVDFHSVSSAGDWFGYMDTAKYMWAYGCGAGSWNSCSGVGITPQFASAKGGALFYMVFGSFFGDWDHADAFTKAPIGATALISCWAGRPHWFFHPLAEGQTFGYCAKLSQSVSGNAYFTGNNKHVAFQCDYVYGPSIGGVHMGLMGDPTLRMNYVGNPPVNLSAGVVGNTVHLTWSASGAKAMNYNVYRAPVVAGTVGNWTKLSQTPVNGTYFSDASPLADSAVYIVRAAELLTTPSGTYYNESAGVMQGIRGNFAGIADAPMAATNLRVSQDGDFLTVQLSEASYSSTRITLVDIAGRELATLHDGPLNAGSYSYRANMAPYASGVYFVRVISEGSIQTAKFIK